VDEPEQLDTIHLLIRRQCGEAVCFLVYPHDKWKHPDGSPYWTLPTKKTVTNPSALFRQGTSLEHFLEDVLRLDLQLPLDAYALEQELDPAEVTMKSRRDGRLKHYTIYPVDVWVDPSCHEALRAAVGGQWLTCEAALNDRRLSETAAAVFKEVGRREERLNALYRTHPEKEQEPGAPRRLLQGVADRPTMDALALRWLSHNRGGVRHLPKGDLDAILAAAKRAFNLRVADPYLRYQLQGLGFTWSFFTHKDPQDLHVHGAPVVEVYGVLEGELEVWWKPYHDRGTSAWSRRLLKAGDWLEVDALQCHIVQWRSEQGKGVVFKAGPGPLAEVGRLGVKGKTPCKDCACVKPPEVAQLNQSPARH
jgi:hypothetical protein